MPARDRHRMSTGPHSAIATPNLDAVKAFQAASLQRHAIMFGEWMSNASLSQARRRGHINIRPAYARLLIYLAWDGSRISDLARVLDVSKNAVGQVVSEMDKLGYVERIPDPTDGRAKLVRYTPQGLALLADALDIGSTLDSQIENIIGPDRFTELRKTLADLCDRLSPVDRLRNGSSSE